jgi:aspartate/methionine/tyrosine aminotransferase
LEKKIFLKILLVLLFQINAVGATEALFAIMQALLNENDEVLMLEPAFDIYPAQVQMASGVSKFVPLRLSGDGESWSLSMQELEAAITPKTRLLLYDFFCFSNAVLIIIIYYSNTQFM